MGIQDSINRVLYYAGAYKIATKRNNYWGAKEQEAKAPKADKPLAPAGKIKTQAGKLKTMRERAFSSAMDEAEARSAQRKGFYNVYKGEFI